MKSKSIEYSILIYCVSILAVIGFFAIALIAVRDYFFLFDDYSLIGAGRNCSALHIWENALGGFYRPLVYLLFKLQFQWFGWRYPCGYLAISLSLHFANALLFMILVRKLCIENLVPTLAGIFFLLSPWAGETFSWASCQFDLCATFGILSGLFFALVVINRRPGGGAWYLSLLGIVFSSIFALFAKESSVILPLLVPVVALYHYSWKKLCKNPGFIAVEVILIMSLALYSFMRVRGLPAFGGSYGDYFSLLTETRPLKLIRPFFVLPIDISYPLIHWPGQIAYQVAVIFALTSAFRAHRRAFLLSLLAFGVTLLPVIIFKIGRYGTSGGRFIYLPGAFIVLILGLGFQNPLPHIKKIILGRVAGTILLLFFLSYSFISLSYQGRIWAKATAIASQAMREFSKHLDEGPRFYITDLPYWFVEGPYILKEYAFKQYFQRPDIIVRANNIEVAYQRGRVVYRGISNERFVQYKKITNEVIINLNTEIDR